jgi:hypothetical protein
MLARFDRPHGGAAHVPRDKQKADAGVLATVYTVLGAIASGAVTAFMIAVLLCPATRVDAAVVVSVEASIGGSPVERALANEARDEIGRSYWVRGGTTTNRVFCESDGYPEGACKATLFGPEFSERFTIEAVNTERPKSREETWFRVRFDSGRIAYLNADTLRAYLFVPLRYESGQLDTSRPIYELFFHERPATAIARVYESIAERRNEADRSEAARASRGGIRIGMTKREVRDSAWGAPDRVRSVSGFGPPREEWIYPGGDSVLFEYGRVVAVGRWR